MSSANYVIDQETKEFIWDKNAKNIAFLQQEVDAIEATLQNRFFKANFTGEEVLTSNGESPTTNNQIDLFGFTFGIISINMAIKSVSGTDVKALYQYDFGFQKEGGVYELLGAINKRVIHETGANVSDLEIAFDIALTKFQVKVNPNGNAVNASISIKISSA